MTERITWRGSEASARILADRVNRRDAKTDRGDYFPKTYATAETEIQGVYAGGFTPIRNTSLCTVDAYDGRHHLGPGDTLVETENGWRVEKADQ